MRLAIIGAGPVSSEQLAMLYHYDAVYAADGGADHCIRAGITPTAIIGDGDSTTVTFDRLANQDTADLQKVLAAVPSDCEIDLYGVVSEDRFDHTLTALQLLQSDQRIHHVVTEHWVIQLQTATTQYELKVPLQTTISLVAQTPTAQATLVGLQWSGDVTLSSARSGISNVVTSLPARITVDSGAIFVMLPWPYGLNLPC